MNNQTTIKSKKFYQSINTKNIESNIPIKICTHNVRGLSTQSKQFQLIQYVELNNIQVMGLSETKLKNFTAKYNFKQLKNYTTFFDNNSSAPSGAGVGLLVHNNLAKHIHKVGKYNGRIIYIDFSFKGHNKIRIIQIYLQANIHDRKDIEQTYKYLSNIVHEAHNKNIKIILMGDFNIDPEKRNIDQRKWRYKILNTLENEDMLDVYEVFNEVKNNNNAYTFIPTNTNLSCTRIDLIYMSRALINEVLSCDNHKINVYESDHKALFIMLLPDILGMKSMAAQRQKKIKRRHFDYDKMTKEKWDKYAEKTDMIINKFNLENLNIQNEDSLNYYWNIIHHQIYLTAISNIDNHMSAMNKEFREDLPDVIVDIQKDIKFTNSLCSNLRSKFLKPDNFEKLKNKWESLNDKIKNIFTKYKQNTDNLLGDFNLNKDNVQPFKKELKKLNKLIRLKYDIEHKKYQDKKIKEFVQRRYEDLKENKKHMIDSFTNKEYRKIIIDRVIDTDNQGQEILLTDPELIKQKVKDHFEHCAGSINQHKTIPERWKEQYAPIETIDDSIYNSLLSEPTLEEWNDIMNHLPMNKAAGPSCITNEMLKHLGPEMQKIIWKLVCACLHLGVIPSQWKKANVYPIPKPHEWECNLNNTRPIVLLETLRKAVIRLLNTRLAKIFVDNRILKGNQFAGLPGSSTFEPIRIMNEIIQDARDTKNEIWVLFQDLSKAYDRVNIFMLEKALERLKLPGKFIKFITNIFIDRKNRIFTEVGLTDEYTVLTGIDQGEVISPLLWCIYLDPLLCEIEKNELGYNLGVSYRKNIYNSDSSYDSICISDVAFMDDITWVTESKEALESMLEIANDFYELNSIKVNKNKSILLTNNKVEEDIQGKVNLKFGNESIKLNVNKEPARLLGVWIYLKDNKNFVFEQAKDDVIKFCNIMRAKKATDKQILYLWNMVIIPKIEYRTQITIFSKRECDSIVAPFRKFFKYKINFASTAPNAIMNNREIYNYRDLYEVQLQSKLTNFLIQLNDTNILGKVTNIRLKRLQVDECLVNSPLVDWKFENFNRHIRSNFILSMITLCNIHKFSFTIKNQDKYTIQGGRIILRDIMGHELWYQYKKSIKIYNILFLEQITSLRGDCILNWRDIMRKNFISYSANKIPKWFILLEQKLLVSSQIFNSRKIKNELIFPCKNFKGHDFNYIELNNRRKDWVAIWNPFLQRSILGRIIKKYPDTNQIILEHWIYNEDQLFVKNPNISLCSGCIINNPNCNGVEQKATIFETTCANLYYAYDALPVWDKGVKVIQKNKAYWTEFSIFEVLQQAEYHFSFLHKLIEYKIEKTIPFSNEFRGVLDKHIAKGPLKKELFIIQQQLINLSTLNFYIDGSVKDYASVNAKAALAFVQTSSPPLLVNTVVEFKAQCENFPTKRKTLILAILAALVVSPPNSTVTIHTYDFKLCQFFSDFIFKHHTTRDFFKTNYNIFWFTIKNIITTHKLLVKFIPLQKKNNNLMDNLWINKLEDLIAQAYDSNVLNLELNYNIDQIEVFPNWNNLYLERNLRILITKLSRCHGVYQFLSLFRNRKYTPDTVNWNFTFKLLNDEEGTEVTDESLSYHKSRRVKLLIGELPTIEHMKKIRYDLYSGWLCPVCFQEKETFEHVFTCTNSIDIIRHIINSIKIELIQLLRNHTRNSLISLREIELNSMWDIRESPSDITFVDLIKGIVPTNLYTFIFDNVHDLNSTLYILRVFYRCLQHAAMFIWENRCKHMIELENKMGIDRKIKKKMYYKRLPYPYSNHHNSSLYTYDAYDLLMEFKFGGNFLNFYLLINHLIFWFWCSCR